MSIVRSPTRRSTSLDLNGDVFGASNFMLINSQQSSSNSTMSQTSGSTISVADRRPLRPRKNTTSTLTTGTQMANDITLDQIKSLLDQQTVSCEASIDSKLNCIIDTFKSFTVTVNKKFAMIDAELGQVNNNIQALNTTIGSNTTQIKINTSTIADNKTSITQMSDDINNGKLILERMPNVIVFGIPEDPDNNLNTNQRIVSDREVYGVEEIKVTDRLDGHSGYLSGLYTGSTSPKTSTKISID
ncbi:uncharacterized protein LOC122849235 isoform X1 [Aphidius gifuensis]|uniref:uncharacterized protein LOC122849235 isoform X1 n=1 Tax=Aphidius gifuensis TaxID=684658 RepID=UPI001CDB59FA|nr:uncharacterized protein LOC122849235 isoform X1 [Aphidius gifuensis]